MSDIRTTWVAQNSSGDWSIESGALASGSDLETAVLISLFTDGLADADDSIPDGTTDRRGWWGDLDEDKPIGSRLWLLDRSRLDQGVANTAKVYIAEALQWLLDDGVAVAVNVSAVITGRGRLDTLVTITKSDGSNLSLGYNWAWQSA